MGFYTTQRDMYRDQTSSDITSDVVWVGDARNIDLFLRGSPSTTTIQSSLADGRTSSIAENSWSAITTVTAHSGLTEIIDIDPYPGWMRLQRSETTEARLGLQNEVR